jgi:hypothetical protein
MRLNLRSLQTNWEGGLYKLQMIFPEGASSTSLVATACLRTLARGCA